MADEPRSAANVTHPGGMRANRVFPTDRVPHLDPFVVFEQFHIAADQGFDTHPHRGFEIVSYMLDGGMVHEDSMGTESIAGPGDAMAITTGSGMHHSELPADDSPCRGLQLWVNLPRAKKGIDPAYQEATSEALPVTETDGATVTTVVGEGSPLELQTPMTYRDVRVTDSWIWDLPDEWTGFGFAISGEGTAGGEPIAADEYVTATGPDSVTFTGDDLRIAVVAGRPHDEPIQQRGPYVD